MRNFFDEDILVENLRKGNTEAFMYLVDHYHQRLFGYALTLTNDDVMAQDVVQNVYLKTWEKRKKIQIRASLQNYLFKSVYNEFVNQYKKRRSTMLLEKNHFDALGQITAAYQESALEQKFERVRQEIQNLPTKCKEVFLMSRKEGLTNLEISNHLNVSIKTVEAHMTHAFSLLRKSLQHRTDLTVLLISIFGLLA